jgi:hypothetical protein
VLAPEIAGLRAAIPVILPPLIATLGVLPILAAPRHGKPGAAAAIGVLVPLVLMAVVAVVAWVRWREAIHQWFHDAMRDAKTPPVR